LSRSGAWIDQSAQAQDGPHGQVAGVVSVAPASAIGSAAHWQVGAQVQGLQVQVIGELLGFGLRWA
jgi:hypothetical protein